MQAHPPPNAAQKESSGKRVVAHMVGGLGNQMFIYASAWALARANKAELYLDTSGFARDFEYKRNFQLGHFQTGQKAKLKTFAAIDFAYRVWRKVAQKLPLLPMSVGPVLGERLHLETLFDPAFRRGSLREHQTLHVFGFRQNEKYFADYRAELLEEFAMLLEPSAELREQAEMIRNTESVSVNFRLLHETIPGTSIPKPNLKTLGARYYHHAVQAVLVQKRDPVFYCFGDQIEGIEALMPAGAKIVKLPDTPDQPADIRDFWLMRQCKNFIIANSSYSWWAAWLGQRQDSMVICPDTEGFTYKIAPADGWIVVKP